MAGTKKFNIEGVTINRRIAESVARNPNRPAISSKSGKHWTTLNYEQFETNVKDLSLGLRALGIGRGDRVALLSENRPEWAITDIAILAAGAVTVPIYSTLPPAQVAHILVDSGAHAIIVSDQKQLSKILIVRERCPELIHIVVMDSRTVEAVTVSYAGILEQGKSFTPQESFEERRNSVRPSDLASLVYTSGTTGEPKGAMLTHENFVAMIGMAEIWFPLTRNDSFLSFLPLCHVFERVVHFLSLAVGTRTYYAESIFKVQENLMEVHPTIMVSVPRLYETIHERILDTIGKAPQKMQKAAAWAFTVGNEYATRLNHGNFISPALAAQRAIADKLVLSKIRARLGGNLRFFVSGGAPLAQTTAEFFNTVNIPILEGYGLTETTAALTCNPYHRSKVGTVGQGLASVKLKIAGDGEILAKGPSVMSGYWNNPGATHEMFDDDGWLKTGDIGVIDQAGFLKITDRKKDIIVLANGKNVAPLPIEGLMKQSPLIAEIVLFGDKSGTVGALVLPNFEKLSAWAKEIGLEETDVTKLRLSPEAKKKIKSEIDGLSGDLAEFEKIRKIALLHEPLTIEKGELTPTLKVRRKVVYQNYGHLLD
jgi:long-chain acyl-CoA synthetase